MKTTDRKVVDDLRERYPKGTRVELIRMEDIQAPPVGTRGTVTAVDDMGTIHVRWDNGSSLGVAYGADACKVLIGEFTDTVRRQILAVRETGETNMFDVPMVQQIANRLGYHELVLFLIDHRKEYAHFIMTGEVRE